MSKVIAFLNEVWAEVEKITWLSRDEFMGSTIIVCILIAFFAVILGAMDACISFLVKLVF